METPFIEMEARLVGSDGSRSATKVVRAENYAGHHVHSFLCNGPCEVIAFEHRCMQVDPRWKWVSYPSRKLKAGDSLTINHGISLDWNDRQ